MKNSMIDSFRQLQNSMPYTKTLWSNEFRADPRQYKHFLHCLTNMAAKLGSLFAMIEMADHGHCEELGLDRDRAARALAFIIMSAMKAANVYPTGPLDLAKYIEADLIRRGNGDVGNTNGGYTGT